MRSSISFLGISIDMRSRKRRRTSVLAVYVALLGSLGWTWRSAQGEFLSVFFVCFLPLLFLFFGGWSERGLIQPFRTRRTAVWYSDDPPPFSRIDQWFWRRAPRRADQSSDEREARRMDRSRAVTQAITSNLLFADFCLLWLTRESTSPVGGIVPRNLPFLLLMAIVLLNFTLPQAIVIWTEPDMESEPGK